MRLNIATLLLVSSMASAVATPPQPPVQERTHTLMELNKAVIDGNNLPPNCNLGSCLNLGGEVSCIISAIASGDPAALQKCISSSVSQMCSCAACIPMLANFLTSIGVCPSTNTTVQSL